MDDDETLPGDRRVADPVPDWTGLEAMLPLDLCAPFMWMGAARLADGTVLGLYKHSSTRRYLRLDRSGTAYGYLGSVCQRIRHTDAVEHAFPSGWLLRWGSEHEEALLLAFDAAAARDRADFESGQDVEALRL